MGFVNLKQKIRRVIFLSANEVGSATLFISYGA
jgi:hypothetical protein